MVEDRLDPVWRPGAGVLASQRQREGRLARLRVDGPAHGDGRRGHPAVRTGTVNPDKPVGHEVRFDWRTGRGRGLELDRPPFNLLTQEAFRVEASPHEVIVTERVFLPVSVKTPAGARKYAEYRYGGGPA